ncbi:MAG: hypothetical protein U1E10_10805, partial [Bdellovibrionales bacterium]|nr:hypothetical protein [Bdellovibrionales bacterium]
MKFPIKLTAKAFLFFAMLVAALTIAPSDAFADRPAFDQKFLDQTARLDVEVLRTLPAHDSGRLKPLDTLARETLLYITGSRKPMGVDPLKLFINLMVEPDAAQLQLIEIRSVDLRKSLN